MNEATNETEAHLILRRMVPKREKLEIQVQVEYSTFKSPLTARTLTRSIPGPDRNCYLFFPIISSNTANFLFS